MLNPGEAGLEGSDVLGWTLAQCWAGSVGRAVWPSLSGSPQHHRLDMASGLMETPASAAAGSPPTASVRSAGRPVAGAWGAGAPGAAGGPGSAEGTGAGTAERGRAVVSSDELGQPGDRNTKPPVLSRTDVPRPGGRAWR